MDRTLYNTSILLTRFVLKTHFLLARSTDFSQQLTPFIQRPSKLKVSISLWGRRGTEPSNPIIIIAGWISLFRHRQIYPR
jgi:hypothetical protein